MLQCSKLVHNIWISIKSTHTSWQSGKLLERYSSTIFWIFLSVDELLKYIELQKKVDPLWLLIFKVSKMHFLLYLSKLSCWISLEPLLDHEFQRKVSVWLCNVSEHEFVLFQIMWLFFGLGQQISVKMDIGLGINLRDQFRYWRMKL